MGASLQKKLQSGYILPLVLVLVLVVGVLAIGSLRDSAQQERQSGVFTRQAQMFELAEAQLMKIELALLEDSDSWFAEANSQNGQCTTPEQASVAGGFSGLALFPHTEPCGSVVWSSWLSEHCDFESSLGDLQIDVLPNGWSACATLWQATYVGQDTSGSLEAHAGAFGESAPIWRYLVTVKLAAPESQGGGRVVLQSLLNAEEAGGETE